MSGPKVSVYEMSAQQRQNLRAQMNCLQQSLVCCEEIKKAVVYLNGLNGQIQTLLSTFDLVNQRTSDCSEEITSLSDLQNKLPQDCQSFMTELSSIPVLPVDKITLTEAELAKRKDTLAKLRALRNSVVARQKKIETALKPMEEKAKQGVNDVKNAIADDIAGVHSFFVLPVEPENEKFQTEKVKIEEQLRVLAIDATCPVELKGEVVSSSAVLSRITTQEWLSTFQAVTIQPLLNRIEAARVKAQEEKSEYDELQARYLTLCSVAGIQSEELSPASGSLEQIKNKVVALEKRIIMQTEQGYISDCVNEVMSEMGYDIIGDRSVVKRSGKRFRNELFSYGDGTAINVTYDSEGQIAMELGGIDRTDRIPTAEEADVLQEGMKSFCSDFRDFEERLKAKGVMIKSRLSMAPPSAEYATIINVSDYTITAKTPVREMTVSEKLSKITAKRTMRKEDN